tara:strand:+ start:1649 stop:2296 length:648 start_codon:yes stop_codon:yes gene_type:complete
MANINYANLVESVNENDVVVGVDGSKKITTSGIPVNGGGSWKKVTKWEIFQNQLPLYGAAANSPYAWDIGLNDVNDTSNPSVGLTLSKQTASDNDPIYANLLTFNTGGVWRFSAVFISYRNTQQPYKFMIQLFKKGTSNPIDQRIISNNCLQGSFPVPMETWVNVSPGDEYYYTAGQTQGQLADQLSLRTEINFPADGLYDTASASLELWHEEKI